jgi:hypothetical protein
LASHFSHISLELRHGATFNLAKTWLFVILPVGILRFDPTLKRPYL